MPYAHRPSPAEVARRVASPLRRAFRALGGAILVATFLIGSAAGLGMVGSASTPARAHRLDGRTVEAWSAGAFSDSLAEPGLPATITLRANVALSVVGEGVSVDATLVDSAGRPVTDGIPVVWQSPGSSLAPVTSTTSAGRSRTVWSRTVAGTSRITATAGAAVAWLELPWQPGPPSELRLEAPARAGVSTRVPLAAVVSDPYGNAVTDGIRVSFVGNGGSAKPAVAETVAGRAESTWRAGATPGRFTLRAEAAGALGPDAVDEVELELLPADLQLQTTVHAPAGRLPEAQAHPGDPLTWTLRVSNAGMAVAEAPRLSVELPTVFDAPEMSSSRPITRLGGADGGWRLPDLAPGEGITVDLATATRRDAEWTGADLFFLRAEADSETAEASTGDHIRTDQIRIYAADLYAALRLDLARSSLRPGGSLVYQLLFGNIQPQTQVRGMRITDTLPAGTRFDHWEAEPGSAITETQPFDAAQRELSWKIDGIAPGSGSLQLWLAIDEDAAPQSVLRNTVEIGSPVLDIRSDNDFGQDDGAWIPGVDLQAELEGPVSLRRGASGRYVLRVHNGALRDEATEVIVEAVLAPGSMLEAVEGPGEPAGDGRIRWRLERMGPGATREMAFQARLPADAVPGERFSFVATAGNSVTESDPSNDRAVWTTEVASGPPRSLRLSALRLRLDACAGEHTTVRAELEDEDGFPVADGLPVRWSTTSGLLSAPDAAPGASLTTLTRSGVATTTFTAAGPPGPVTLAAAAGDASAGMSLTMTAGPPVALSLSAEPMIVLPGGLSTITAQVFDACAQPVADGSVVQLSAARGSFDGQGQVVERDTRAGRVTTLLAVGQEPGPLRVSASVGEPASIAEVQLDVRAPATPPPPPRWTIHLPFMRGGVRPARAATR